MPSNKAIKNLRHTSLDGAKAEPFMAALCVVGNNIRSKEYMRIFLKDLVILLCGVISSFISVNAFSDAHEIAELQVMQSSMTFVLHDKTTYVTSIGKIKNTTENSISDVVLEAQFYDSHGGLIDVAQDNLYYLNIPPHSEVAFKLQTVTAAMRDQYSSQSVRVIGFNEEKPCGSSNAAQRKQKKNVWLDIFISWFPMILLILVWVLLAKRYSGKNSAQNRTVDLVEKQNELFDHQNQLLERIANAAEQKASENKSNT